MPALFEAYITNLGKYNEGELVGEYLKFPTTPEEVQALLKRIGIDGVRYEEIFITDFDGDVLGLYDHLGEYENIDELILPFVRCTQFLARNAGPPGGRLCDPRQELSGSGYG